MLTHFTLSLVFLLQTYEFLVNDIIMNLLGITILLVVIELSKWYSMIYCSWGSCLAVKVILQ